MIPVSDSDFKVENFDVYKSIMQKYMGFYEKPKGGYGAEAMRSIHKWASYEYKLLVDLGFIENG